MSKLSTLLVTSYFSMVAYSQSAVSVYLSPPENQNVMASDFGTDKDYTFQTATFDTPPEDFAGLTSGTSGNTGTYLVTGGTPTISDNANYGGGTGQGNYLSISNDASISITFDAPVNYFGFQWTAGNAGNRVTLYDTEGTNLGTFDTGTITTLLPNTSDTTIEAVNGQSYNTNSYYGLPGDRGTTNNEAFAYIHFVNNGPLPISRIELSHSGDGAFESDNHSVRFDKVIIDAPSSPLVNVGDITVPEPSSAVLFGMLAATGFLRRKR